MDRKQVTYDDAYLRFDSMLKHVDEVKTRLEGYSFEDKNLLIGLIEDFREAAIQLNTKYVNATKDVKDKLLKRHQMVDILLSEWQNIFSLVSTSFLGNSYVAVVQPYINLAMEDLGLKQTEINFLLPKFGKKFSLSKPRYATSPVRILEVPLSVINAIWEYTVIWHELASIKVDKIRDELNSELDEYRKKHDIDVPVPDDEDPISALLGKIKIGDDVDILVDKVKSFLNDDREEINRLWTLEWMVQFYEDACSVLAFGEDFIILLESILGRDQTKLTGDISHPDRETRIKVAESIWNLKKGKLDKSTDEVAIFLWDFMQTNRPGYLPIVGEAPGDNDLRMELSQNLKAYAQGQKPLPDYIVMSIARDEKRGKIGEFLDSIIDSSATVDDLLSIKLSEVDALALTEHSSSDITGSMSITVHGTTHEFYHAWWTHK